MCCFIALEKQKDQSKSILPPEELQWLQLALAMHIVFVRVLVVGGFDH